MEKVLGLTKPKLLIKLLFQINGWNGEQIDYTMWDTQAQNDNAPLSLTHAGLMLCV